MIKAIIFDFFDVIRSDPYNAWLRNHGYERKGSFSEVVQKFDIGSIDMKGFFDTLSSLSGQPVDTIHKEFDTVAAIDSDVVSILSKLKANYKVGLLTNADSVFLRQILKENNLEQYFDEVVISSEVGYSKPSKEIFDIMLKRLNFDPGEALFIDDSLLHIDGAEAVGIQGIQFQGALKLSKDLMSAGVVGL